MKKFLLTIALIASLAVSVHAQTVVVNRGGGGSVGRTGGVVVGTGVGYGYGYGYGYTPYRPLPGYGYGYRPGYCYSPWRPGCGWGYGGYYGGYSGWGYGGYGGYYGMDYGYGYPGDYYGNGGPTSITGSAPGAYGPNVSAGTAGPMPPSRPAVDRMPEFMSARGIEEGRRRFRLGDYRGAAEEFRSALLSQTENPYAQAWFALALIMTGDGKNADKALRASAGSIAPDQFGLPALLKDEKERARVVAYLSSVNGEGALAAAFALSLLGDAEPLKKAAMTDPAAGKLLKP